MNILVIDRAPPCNLLQGNALIGHHLFSRLRHHHLTLICPATRQEIAQYKSELVGLFDTVHLVPREKPIDTLMGLAEPYLVRVGIEYGKAVDKVAINTFQECVKRVLAVGSFDIIHTRQLPMAAITAGIKHPAKLLELVDSETLQARRRVHSKSPKTWVRAICARIFEAWAVRHFHACTSVADADAQVIRGFAGGIPVRIMPNGVDAVYFAPQELPETLETSETIIFTGAMSFSPNITAVLHFFHHILPLIRRERPGVRLVIAGRDPSPEIAALANDPFVTVTGFVEDMRPWLARSSIMICPMLTGSGIKNKVLEALAMAKPIVSTTLGIEALEVMSGRELLVADTPADFAAATLALLRDSSLRRRLGAAGRELVLRRYTWDACAASYDALYAELASGHGYVSQLARQPDKSYEHR
jgi:glycosyltransferase involved in cell wall biosynthesis